RQSISRPAERRIRPSCRRRRAVCRPFESTKRGADEIRRHCLWTSGAQPHRDRGSRVASFRRSSALQPVGSNRRYLDGHHARDPRAGPPHQHTQADPALRGAGATVPQFAHLPLILAPNKSKLSKRKHGEVVSLTTYRDRGFVPAAFRNFLALLGWSPPDGKEVQSKEELVRNFSLEGIGRANAIFNFHENDPRRWTDDKALWMNSEYIRTMPLDELLPMVKTELRANKLWREEYDDDDSEWFRKTVNLIRERYFTLKDFSA